MSKLRRQLSVGTSNTVETKNLDEIKKKTGNLYESISIEVEGPIKSIFH